tara:strand:- start:6797 stop:7693 length:897 start_codon:yes stop_codon:yes gene_type:complete
MATSNVVEINTDSNVAPVSSRAMIVRLSGSKWTARKKDKKATNKILNDNNAVFGAATVTKSVLEGCSQLKAVELQYSLCHRECLRLTQPFDDEWRMLGVEMFPEFNHIMSGHISKYYTNVDEFCDAYQFERFEAQHRLGDLYNEEDYPDVETVRAKFGMRIKYLPMPDTGHWALDMSNDMAGEIIDHFNVQMREREQENLRSIFEQAHKYLSNMSKQMAEFDNKDKPKLYDTLVTNITDLATMMKKCNPYNDPDMERMYIEMMEAMRGVSKEGLRTSSDLRAKTKVAVDDIIKGLPSF